MEACIAGCVCGRRVEGPSFTVRSTGLPWCACLQLPRDLPGCFSDVAITGVGGSKLWALKLTVGVRRERSDRSQQGRGLTCLAGAHDTAVEEGRTTTNMP